MIDYGDLIKDFFHTQALQGYYHEPDIQEHVRSWYDGCELGLDDSELIEYAQEGLDSYGEFEVTKNIRRALERMAYEGVVNEATKEVFNEALEHDLELSDSLAEKKEDWDHEDGEFYYFLDDEEIWRHDEEMDIWIELTSTQSMPSAVDLLRVSIEAA